jgi:hypothetical protein
MYIGGDSEGLADWKLENCIPETKVLLEGDSLEPRTPRELADLQERT